MTVLFLDIDGVLVTRRTLAQRLLGSLNGSLSIGDPACIAQVNRIVESTGCEVVLSSSWRYCGQEEMNLILQHWGCDFRLAAMTPCLTTKEHGVYLAKPRSHEIQQYLDGCDCDAFAIIDDEADMDGMEQFLVKTVFETGLTAELADKAIRLLLK